MMPIVEVNSQQAKVNRALQIESKRQHVANIFERTQVDQARVSEHRRYQPAMKIKITQDRSALVIESKRQHVATMFERTQAKQVRASEYRRLQSAVKANHAQVKPPIKQARSEVHTCTLAATDLETVSHRVTLSLLSLPAEIRLEIYYYCFVDLKIAPLQCTEEKPLPFQWHEHRLRQTSDLLFFCAPLLHINHLIRQEIIKPLFLHIDVQLLLVKPKIYTAFAQTSAHCKYLEFMLLYRAECRVSRWKLRIGLILIEQFLAESGSGSLIDARLCHQT